MTASKTHTNPWLKENLQYLWYVLGGTVLMLSLPVVVMSVQDEPVEFSTENIIFFISLTVIPMTTVNTIYLMKRLIVPMIKTQNQVMLVKIIGLFMGAIAATVFFEWVYGLFGIVDDDYIVLGSWTLSPSESEVVSNTINAAIIGIPVFIWQRLKTNADIALEQKKKELVKANELNTQSQLEALQARVNPHFLYNSLNSIASLIHINPDQAEQMVLSLSELFRYSLNYSNGQLSTIAQEVKMVETYLSIELIRFGDKLQCEINVDKSLEQVLIPRFLLQPIVENAIKHGASKLASGSISMEIKRNGPDLVFTIADNGPDFPADFNAGYGIKCVTDQLNLLYNDKHSFAMLNEPEKHVKIILENALNDA